MASLAPPDSIKDITDPLLVDKLATGLLDHYQQPLEKVEKKLQEVCTRQSSITVTLEKERKRLTDPNTVKELTEMYAQIKTYTAKLVVLKKEMQKLSEKAAHIKKRAVQLEADKKKEAILKEAQRETQLQHEQELIAKPTTSSKSPSS